MTTRKRCHEIFRSLFPIAVRKVDFDPDFKQDRIHDVARFTRDFADPIALTSAGTRHTCGWVAPRACLGARL